MGHPPTNAEPLGISSTRPLVCDNRIRIFCAIRNLIVLVEYCTLLNTKLRKEKRNPRLPPVGRILLKPPPIHPIPYLSTCLHMCAAKSDKAASSSSSSSSCPVRYRNGIIWLEGKRKEGREPRSFALLFAIIMHFCHADLPHSLGL